MNNSVLLRLRTSHRLSSKDLSAILNVSDITYYKYETGRHSPPLQAMYILADFYGVSLDYMYGRTGSLPHSTTARTVRPAPSQAILLATIGEQLQSLRRRRDLTQDKLAIYLGISRVSYSYFENGKRQLSPVLLCKLADYYAVTIDWLFQRNL